MGMYKGQLGLESHEVVDSDGVVRDVPLTAGIWRGGRFRVTSDPKGTSMTKQEFVDECDINNIMAQYQKTGMVNHVSRFQGRYEDVTGAVPFHEAQNIVLAATDAFMSVPSSVRAEFDNDPGAFLAFVNDPANAEKMRKMGLLKENPNGEVSRQTVRSPDAGKPDGAVERPVETGTVTGSDKR